MIDHSNPLKILPVAIFVIFLLTEGLCRKTHSKYITLESNSLFLHIYTNTYINNNRKN